MEYDGTWLASQLVENLDGWDLDLAQSVVATIDSSSTMDEVDDIVMNFMDGNSAARSSVERFWRYKKQVESEDWSAPPQQQPPGRDAPSDRGGGMQSQPGTPWSSTGQHHKEQSDKGKRKPLPKTQAGSRGLASRNYMTQAIDAFQAQNGAKTVKKPQSGNRGKGDKKAAAASSSSVGPSQVVLTVDKLEKKVANCLNCGKVYDCRKPTAEIIKFLKSGGKCNFCGESVKLHVNESSSNGHGHKSSVEGTDTATKVETSEMDEGMAAAIKFKDTLVEYDRTAEKRTTVIDDQSDFLEIDSNVWLSDKERQELRERCQHEREVAERRELEQKRQVRYTIDLVGRQVLIADEAEASEDTKAKAKMAEVAAAATAHEIPQGGGRGASSAAETAERLGGSGGQAFRKIRAAEPNPSIPGPAPIFIPSGKENEGAVQSTSRKGRDRWDRGFGGRLQHDDIFAGFEAEAEVDVLFEDLASILNTQTENTFDICLPTEDDAKEAMPSLTLPKRDEPIVSANVRLSTMLVPSTEKSPASVKSGEARKLDPWERLPPGMVLLKGWLSMEEQVSIVRHVRDLGVGPGGFYSPNYSSGGSLKLMMMCLGKNWNLDNRTYEDVRSNYDGATPPPIPQYLHDMVQRSLLDASQSTGPTLPKMHPNVCLCNFYSAEGSLGLHQDREEGEQSCGRGIPVVSFSIGSTASFVFNKRQSMNGASCIHLESGDVLVFGGPSRMIYHGVKDIVPDTMPPALVSATNMRKGRLNLTFRQYIP